MLFSALSSSLIWFCISPEKILGTIVSSDCNTPNLFILWKNLSTQPGTRSKLSVHVEIHSRQEVLQKKTSESKHARNVIRSTQERRLFSKPLLWTSSTLVRKRQKISKNKKNLPGNLGRFFIDCFYPEHWMPSRKAEKPQRDRDQYYLWVSDSHHISVRGRGGGHTCAPSHDRLRVLSGECQ